MAAKKKTTHTVGAQHETTIIFAKKGVVEELRDLKRDTKKRVQGQNGKVGQRIGQAVENDHLNRKAFGMACQLDALDDETLHIVYHNLLFYCEALGVTKRATAQEELFEAGEMGAGAEPTGLFKDKSEDGEAGGRKSRASTKKDKAGSGGTVVAFGDGRSVSQAAGKDD